MFAGAEQQHGGNYGPWHPLSTSAQPQEAAELHLGRVEEDQNRGGGPEQSQSSENLLASVAAARPQGEFHRHNYAPTSNQRLSE